MAEEERTMSTTDRRAAMIAEGTAAVIELRGHLAEWLKLQSDAALEWLAMGDGIVSQEAHDEIRARDAAWPDTLPGRETDSGYRWEIWPVDPQVSRV
jgi:hypothetical protein